MMLNRRGQSLIEVILVMFLFAVLGTGLLSTLLSSMLVSSRGVEFTLASGYIQEGIEAVRSIRNRDWSELTNGTHGLSTNSGYYVFAGTSDSLDGGRFTRTITVEDVYRTGSLTGDIAETGILDAATKRITINVTWEVPAGLTKNIDAVFFVTNVNQQSWVQTLTADFEAGFENSTTMTTNANGEVTLRAHNSDWENVESLYRFGLIGGGDRKAIYADPDSDLVFVLGDTDTGEEFHILDMSDVSENQPTVIAAYECASCNDFAVRNGYVYLVAHESGPGAEVLILSIPTLSTVGTINLPRSSSANGVDIQGTTLVVVRGYDTDEEEIVFYDVSDPSGPVYLGGADTEYLLDDVAYNGSYAFASGYDDTNEVTAVSQSTFSVIDTIDLSGTANTDGIDWFDSYVYVGKGNNSSGGELYKINVTDPANMVLSAELEVGDSVNDVKIDTNGDYLVAATRYDTKNFFIVDIPTFLETHSGDLYGGTQAESTDVFGSHGYVGTTTSGSDIEVFRVSPGGWDDAQLVSSANLSGNHDESTVWVEGNYAYMATENNGSNHDVFIYDISTPSSPTYLGSLDSNSDVNDLLVYGNYIYVATKDNAKEVTVIDVSTKTSPQIVGTFNAAGSADGLSLAREGTTLYLGREDGSDPEFYVLSLAIPSAPSLVGSMQFSKNIERMVANGTYVYAATEHDSQELTVIDASNPASPLPVASLDLAGNEDAQAIALNGTMLAIGRADGGSIDELAIVDISTPTSPQLLGSVDTEEEVSGVAWEDETFVHVATDTWQKEYQRFNVTNPALPALDATFALGYEGEGIFFNGVYAFVATEDNAGELKIIGQGAAPTDVVREGNFTSQPFDAGSEVSWDSLEWTSSGSGSVVFKIRTADTQASLDQATWVGPDGTPGSVFTIWGQGITEHPNATGTRWFQWKALLSGDGSSTPVLEDVTVRYSQ